jgi:hypothetical protein
MKIRKKLTALRGSFKAQKLTALRGGFLFYGFYKLESLFKQFIFFCMIATFLSANSKQ